MFPLGASACPGEVVLRITVNTMLRRMHGRFIEALLANVKDSRLLAVHPDCQMLPHECSLAPIDKGTAGKNRQLGKTTTAGAGVSAQSARGFRTELGCNGAIALRAARA